MLIYAVRDWAAEQDAPRYHYRIGHCGRANLSVLPRCCPATTACSGATASGSPAARSHFCGGGFILVVGLMRWYGRQQAHHRRQQQTKSETPWDRIQRHLDEADSEDSLPH